MKSFSKFKPCVKRLVLGSSIALIASSFGLNSYAATATGSFTVQAVVAASCTISGTTLDFGTINVLGADVDATSTLTATCTTGTPYKVALSAGSAPGATVTTRRMVSAGSDELAYGLYTDSAHKMNWSDDLAEGNVAVGTGDGTGQSITVYGQVPTSSQRSVAVTSYSDTIIATIEY